MRTRGKRSFVFLETRLIEKKDARCLVDFREGGSGIR